VFKVQQNRNYAMLARYRGILCISSIYAGYTRGCLWISHLIMGRRLFGN